MEAVDWTFMARGGWEGRCVLDAGLGGRRLSGWRELKGETPAGKRRSYRERGRESRVKGKD